MRRLNFAPITVIAGAILLTAPAFAQGAPASAPAAAPQPPKLTPLPPIRGVVASFEGGKLVVKTDSGDQSFTLDPKVRVVLVHRIDISEIKPGSFVATANVDQPDGSGVSTELRVFEGSLKGLGEGHGPMTDRAPGTMMTNGTVTSQVVSSPKGQSMDVGYTNKDGTKGVRRITVPTGMVITAWDPGSQDAIKAGLGIQVRAGKTDDGTVVVRFVLLSNTATPPPLI